MRRRLYLIHDIFQGIWAVDGKADEEKVGLRIGEGSKPVVFFLPGGIPQSQLDGLASRLVSGVGDVILEYCWYVFLKLNQL